MRLPAWKSRNNGNKPNQGPSLNGLAAKMRHIEYALKEHDERLTRIERRLKGDAVSASRQKHKEEQNHVTPMDNVTRLNDLYGRRSRSNADPSRN